MNCNFFEGINTDDLLFQWITSYEESIITHYEQCHTNHSKIRGISF